MGIHQSLYLDAKFVAANRMPTHIKFWARKNLYDFG
jgi:hypothetical protein